jgi:hypothetical protein
MQVTFSPTWPMAYRALQPREQRARPVAPAPIINPTATETQPLKEAENQRLTEIRKDQLYNGIRLLCALA